VKWFEGKWTDEIPKVRAVVRIAKFIRQRVRAKRAGKQQQLPLEKGGDPMVPNNTMRLTGILILFLSGLGAKYGVPEEVVSEAVTKGVEAASAVGLFIGVLVGVVGQIRAVLRERKAKQ
jgi:hypothetical protein